MMDRWIAVALVLAGMLAACAETPAAPPVRPAPVAGAAAPAATAAVARFDGRYAGFADQTMSRSSICGPQRITRTLTVTGGQARYVVDEPRNIVATGAVGEDGSVRLVSDAGGNNSVSGRIENGVFTGEYRSTTCGRSLSLRKRD